MICRRCGVELRPNARFCKKCGEPIVIRPHRKNTASRPPTVLPRKRAISPMPDPQRDESPRLDRSEYGVVVPISEKQPTPARDQTEQEPESEIISIRPAKKNDLPPSLGKIRVPEAAPRNTQAPQAVVLRREQQVERPSSRALATDSSRPDKKILALVPLLLLTVILLFIFAYIAAR